MKIIIPFKLLTINHLYGQRGFRRYLKPEAKELKKQIHDIVKRVPKEEKDFNKESKFRIIIEVYEDWYTKKGDIKKKDLDNRCKFCCDSIFDKLKVDDKQIFELTMRKIQSEEEKSVITIVELK